MVRRGQEQALVTARQPPLPARPGTRGPPVRPAGRRCLLVRDVRPDAPATRTPRVQGRLMGWSGYRVSIMITVDAHAGEKQERGERLHDQFIAELEKLCGDERFNNDAITIMLSDG